MSQVLLLKELPYLFLLLGVWASFGSAYQDVPNTLPIFRVKSSYTGESQATELMQTVFGHPKNIKSYRNSRCVAHSDDKSNVVEIDAISGGLWLADESRLWNLNNTSRPPKLPSNDQAKNIADSLVKKYNLLPNLADPFVLVASGVGGTQVGQETQQGENKAPSFHKKDFQLDVSVHYSASIKVPGCGGPVPVVGGGGSFKVTLGEEGRLIGFHGTWRDVQGEGVPHETISQREADQRFHNATAGLNVLTFNSTLAYYSAPFGQVQNFLFPVYVYQATAKFGNDTVQLRNTIYPATTFGIETYDGCLKGSKVATQKNRPSKKQKRSSFGDKKPLKSRGTGWTLGTEWLGVPWGLGGSESNAHGFTNTMVTDPSAGWKSSWDWANYLAWESDWNASDDIWVDAVDFVFYTGHANSNGWLASDKLVDHSIVGAFPDGDRWGGKRLNWLVVAACGPHQDDRIAPGGGNAFDRWRGAFDGLHIMLAYATVTYDNTEEGHRIAKYAQEGSTLINSWFRTAHEIQSSGVIVTAMWAANSGNDASQDHLPGHGYVAQDPVVGGPGGQTRWLMWSHV
jgi:hypothetical protein